MIDTLYGVEVAQENKLFFTGDAADGSCKLVVKLVLGARCRRECPGGHVDEGDRAVVLRRRVRSRCCLVLLTFCGPSETPVSIIRMFQQPSFRADFF